MIGVLVGLPIAVFGLARFGPAPIQERLFGRFGGVVGDWSDQQVEGFVGLCTFAMGDVETCECVANRLQASISSEELIEAFTADETPPWFDSAMENAAEACS